MKKVAAVFLFLLALGLAFITASDQSGNASTIKKLKDRHPVECKVRTPSGEFVRKRYFPLRRVFIRDSKQQERIQERIEEMLKSYSKSTLRISSSFPSCKELSGYHFVVVYGFVTSGNEVSWSIPLPGVRGEFVVVGNRFAPVLMGKQYIPSPEEERKFLDGKPKPGNPPVPIPPLPMPYPPFDRK